MFNLSLVMSLAVFICEQNLHIPQGATLEYEVVDMQYLFSKGNPKVIYFFGM